MLTKPKRFLRLPQVMAKTGLPQSSLYDKTAAGEFPPPVPLGPQTVAWLEDEVENWMAERIALRDQAGKSNPWRTPPSEEGAARSAERAEAA